MARLPRTLLLLAPALLFAACGEGGRPATEGGGQPPLPVEPDGGIGDGADAPLKAEVIRTEFGIPHIFADDFRGFGYGYGYVHAEDNLCVLAEDLITIRGERSKFLGRDGSYTIVANGATASNVESDFFWKHVATPEAIAPIVAGSDPEAIAATEGFVAGYNRYVRELRAGEHPGRHADCAAAEYIGPIEPMDIYRRYFRLVVLASSSVFVNEIAGAQPPGPDNLPLPVNPADIAALPAEEFPLANGLPIASNMYGLGPEATVDGSSMLFGNPHFPWTGTERLYLAHGILPDTNIMGVGLYGVPAALIGFTDQFAWSHTVSTAYRFTFYELTLNPLDPTQYIYEGEIRDMDAREISVEILEDDGSVSTETRTLYTSQFGPMLELQVSGVPVLEWSPAKAYTLRDANAENNRLMNQFFRWNRAKSLQEFKDLHASVLGVPWVNTVAAGPGQPVYYGDVTVVPNVPDSKVTTCSAQPLAAAFGQLVPGLPLLDGSRAACEWDTDPDAPAPGIFGPGNLPTLERADWVHNCNDSYWLTNPEEPITGFAGIIGDEEAVRTLRTRLCIRQVQQRLDGSDGLEGDKFSYEQLKDIVLSSRVYSAELALADVLSGYCALPTLLGSAGPVDATEACAVLTNWDGRNNLDSAGGHIWREFWRNVGNLLPAGPVSTQWLTPFSTNDPVNTPSGLNLLAPNIEQAFADAITTVANSPFGFDTPMGEIQRSGIHLDGPRIPIFGGESFTGSFTIANARSITPSESFPGVQGGLSDEGYNVTYGNSYIQAVTWDPVTGEPRAEAFVTYSQSTDPASPYYRDLTEAYGRKEWVRLRYREEDVRNSPVQVRYNLEE